MRAAFLLVAVPVLAHASVFDEAARLSTTKVTTELLEQAAMVPWPMLDERLEATLAQQAGTLPDEARRAWALDRALPMLSGELGAGEAEVRVLLSTLEEAIPQSARAGALEQLTRARKLYASGRFDQADATYAKVKRTSAAWPDALRERAWTLLWLGQPADALGATVSLRAPWFHEEDHAEARLLEATVLLERCRWKEARDRVAPLTRWASTLDPARAAELLLSQETPAGWKDVLGAPLVERVRQALTDMPSTGAGELRKRAVRALGERLIREEIAAQTRAHEDLSRRALAVVYESQRGERLLREQGHEPAKPRPAEPGPLGDDEVAWDFDGRWWRDELGRYRYVAGDACTRGSTP